MSKLLRILIYLLITSLVLFALYRINAVRYFFVKTVWKTIDWVSNKSADKAILPEGVKVESDIPYVNEVTSKQLLDVYFPEEKKDKLPVIIFTHGGGFVAGDKKQTRQFCMELAKEGYAVFTINYGLAPESKITDQISDVLAAMSWVKENCEKYSGDRKKIVLAGDSAGAYLTAIAASICTNKELSSSLNFKPAFTEEELKAVMLFCGLYDFETGSKTGFPSIKSDIEMALGTDKIESYSKLQTLSVTKNLTSKFPKTFITSGEVDWLYSESYDLIKAMDKNEVYHKDLLFPKTEKKAMHDYQFHMNLEVSKQCLKSVIDFLNAETR